MTLDLCVEPLTVLDVDAATTIDLAAEAGIAKLSFWGHIPWPGMPVPCHVASIADAHALRARLADKGVTANSMEVFELRPDANLASFRASLELGATIGCTAACAIFADDPEPARRLEQFVALCTMAADFKLQINAEFIAYRAIGTLAQATELLMQADQPNARITVDLLHLTRSGGTPADIASLDPRLIGHAQLCDGPAQIDPGYLQQEAFADRMIPGDGDFPIKALVEALPGVALGLEVPYNSPIFAGLTPSERLAKLVAGTKRALA